MSFLCHNEGCVQGCGQDFEETEEAYRTAYFDLILVTYYYTIIEN